VSEAKRERGHNTHTPGKSRGKEGTNKTDTYQLGSGEKKTPGKRKGPHLLAVKKEKPLEGRLNVWRALRSSFVPQARAET